MITDVLTTFDVFCDLNRRTVTWNLFVLCNKEIKMVNDVTFVFTRHYTYVRLFIMLL